LLLKAPVHGDTGLGNLLFQVSYDDGGGVGGRCWTQATYSTDTHKHNRAIARLAGAPTDTVCGVCRRTPAGLTLPLSARIIEPVEIFLRGIQRRIGPCNVVEIISFWRNTKITDELKARRTAA